MYSAASAPTAAPLTSLTSHRRMLVTAQVSFIEGPRPTGKAHDIFSVRFLLIKYYTSVSLHGMPIRDMRWRYFGSLVIIPPAHLWRDARRCIPERGVPFPRRVLHLQGGERSSMLQSFDTSSVDEELFFLSGPGDN